MLVSRGQTRAQRLDADRVPAEGEDSVHGGFQRAARRDSPSARRLRRSWPISIGWRSISSGTSPSTRRIPTACSPKRICSSWRRGSINDTLWKALAFGGIALGIAVCASSAPCWRTTRSRSYYIEADTIEIEGDVVEFQYKNPHSWIFVQGHERHSASRRSTRPNGSASSQLERDGIPKNFFKPGDASASGRRRTRTRPTTASASSGWSAGRTAGSGEATAATPADLRMPATPSSRHV